jgi:hypothetical protein
MSRKRVDPGRAAERRAEQIFGAELTRRGFLRGSAAGVLALGAASLLPSGCARYEPAPDDLKVFNAKEYAIINAAAAIYVGEDLAAEGSDVARFFDGFAATFAPWIQDQIKQALAIFEHGPLLFAFSFKRFTQMDPGKQNAYVDGWGSSSLGFRRTVNTAMRNLCIGAFYLQRSAWKSIHYAGPWIGRLDIEAVPRRFPLPAGSVKR